MRLLLFSFLAVSCLAQTKMEQEVHDAILVAQQNIARKEASTTTIKEDGTRSQSQKANSDAQLEQARGDLMAEVSKILVAKNGREILIQLKTFDVKSMVEASTAGKISVAGKGYSGGTVKRCSGDTLDCAQANNSRFRTFTGVCNNRRFSSFGKTLTPIRRLLGDASYMDNIGEFRSKDITGAPLPSTRLISNRLHAEGTTNQMDLTTSHLHMQFGQFIAHDIIFMPAAGKNGGTIDCSDCNTKNLDDCAPIRVPADDTYFPRNGCLALTRALNGQQGLGQRTQINQNTHFLDLSVVYGSDECVAANVRTFKNGELKEFDAGFVLPPQSPNDTNCRTGAPNHCFLAGDLRNSLHPGLIPLHTVYIKEHNRIARFMKRVRSDWTDEKIFQECRRLMIANYQHHVYNEYLPKLIGAKTMKEFGLTPLPIGPVYFTGYDEKVNPALTAEFAAAAFRFGHSQAAKEFVRFSNKSNVFLSNVGLGSNIFYADSLYKPEGTEAMLHGLIRSPSLKVDRQFSFPIRNQMFETRGKPATGSDLVAINIMRGRDVGLHPYNEYRRAVGLSKANDFAGLSGEMTAENIAALKSVYTSVHDIDLYTGLMMESPANGALLGRTGAYIIAETFANLKKGDRFFYENKVSNLRGLTESELEGVKGYPLSKLMCVNSPSALNNVNQNVFDQTSEIVPCRRLLDFNNKGCEACENE